VYVEREQGHSSVSCEEAKAMGCAVAVVVFVVLLNLLFWKTAPITLALLAPVMVVFLLAVREHQRRDGP